MYTKHQQFSLWKYFEKIFIKLKNLQGYLPVYIRRAKIGFPYRKIGNTCAPICESESHFINKQWVVSVSNSRSASSPKTTGHIQYTRTRIFSPLIFHERIFTPIYPKRISLKNHVLGCRGTPRTMKGMRILFNNKP